MRKPSAGSLQTGHPGGSQIARRDGRNELYEQAEQAERAPGEGLLRVEGARGDGSGEPSIEKSAGSTRAHEAKRAAAADGARYRRSAFTVVYWQLLVTLFAGAAVAVLAAWGDWFESAWRASSSALLGGGVCVIASAYMARKLFKVPAHAPPAAVVRAFYIGEVAKIGISVVLFALSMIYIDLNIPVFFLTYIAALSTYWFALLANASGDADNRGHR
ncbi:MAG: ATP synthase subunit I [Gammaproteobacteria bacterium]